MNSKQVHLSLLRKLVSDSTLLTLAGTSVHHCGAKTVKRCDFVMRPLLALSDSSTRLPAEGVKRVCGLSNAWGKAGAVPLTFVTLLESHSG